MTTGWEDWYKQEDPFHDDGYTDGPCCANCIERGRMGSLIGMIHTLPEEYQKRFLPWIESTKPKQMPDKRDEDYFKAVLMNEIQDAKQFAKEPFVTCGRKIYDLIRDEQGTICGLRAEVYGVPGANVKIHCDGGLIAL